MITFCGAFKKKVVHPITVQGIKTFKILPRSDRANEHNFTLRRDRISFYGLLWVFVSEALVERSKFPFYYCRAF